MNKYQVWYWKTEFAATMLLGDITGIDVGNLEKTHVFLRDVQEPDVEAAYRRMQAENWSPNGEARFLIERKGLGHTSMSMGDILIDEQGVVHVVAMFGFAEIGKVRVK